MIQTIFHGVALAIMVNGWRQLQQTAASEWINTLHGGHFPYLTIQGLLIACITMLFALLADLLPDVTVFDRLRRRFIMIAMPLALVISSIYWSLLFFLPGMILHKVDEPQSPQVYFFIPLHVDVALHAVPAISLVLHFFVFEKRYNGNEAKYGAPMMAVLFSIWYVSCVEYFASLNKVWPYPFLDAAFPIRLAVYFGAVSIALVSFYGLNGLHS